jgi:hypothetical protein
MKLSIVTMVLIYNIKILINFVTTDDKTTLLGRSIKEGEISGYVARMGEMGNVKNLDEKIWMGRDHLGYLSVYRRIILKCALNE